MMRHTFGGILLLACLLLGGCGGTAEAEAAKAEACFNQGRFDLAVKHAENAANKGHIKSMRDVGDMYALQGKNGKAEKYYLMAVRTAAKKSDMDNSSFAAWRLADFYERLGQNDKAQRWRQWTMGDPLPAGASGGFGGGSVIGIAVLLALAGAGVYLFRSGRLSGGRPAVAQACATLRDRVGQAVSPQAGHGDRGASQPRADPPKIVINQPNAQPPKPKITINRRSDGQ